MIRLSHRFSFSSSLTFQLTSLSSQLSTLSFLLMFTSCQQITLDEINSSSRQKVDITATITLDDVWSQQESTATRATGGPLFMVYVFNSSDNAIYNKGGYMTGIDKGVKFDDITSSGSYSLYGVTNLIAGEYTSTGPGVTITSASTFTLNTESAPRDICLGKNTLTVESTTIAYSASIKVNHIMSKLALTVESVPAEVTSMTVTLPNQANIFNFKGEFSGNETSQTLTLSKAATANQDGTYDWTSPATIVYPCAKDTEKMPVTITWGSATVTSKDVNTTSSTCCLSGKNLSLSTTWRAAFQTSASITTSDWSAVEEGTFDW